MISKDSIPSLLEIGDIETKAVLKAAAKAHQALGEVKGVAANIPNQYILIGTLTLQEAKESSAIENIIITHDDIIAVIMNQKALYLIVQKKCITMPKH